MRPSRVAQRADTPSQIVPGVVRQSPAGGGGRSAASSMLPSQSSSKPLHSSSANGKTGQAYSQPGRSSTSTNPSKHAPTTQVPATQEPSALGKRHSFPHTPQCRGSTWRSKPSSMLPLQSSSRLLQASTGSSEGTQTPESIGPMSRRLTSSRSASPASPEASPASPPQPDTQ